MLIPDHHPGFVTWERYEPTQDQLRANWRARRGDTAAARSREGSALLQGRVRCGRCGRMMQIGYSGPTGNCPALFLRPDQAAVWQRSAGARAWAAADSSNRVLDEVFAVLEPASLAATAKALAEADVNHRRHVAVFELAVERARFEAERARRQFDAVEPENRLVARTLERSLGGRPVGAAPSRGRILPPSGSVSRPASPPRRRRGSSRAGADVRAVFHAPTTTWRERKQLLRAVIAEVVVTVHSEERRADVSVVWEGGATTVFDIDLNKTGEHFRTTDEDTVDLVRRLAERYDDTTIAAVL